MLKSEPQAYNSVIALHQLTAQARLGVGEKERGTPQNVIIDVRLYLPAAPDGAQNDDGDYICYHRLSEKIREVCEHKEYRLIEYLTHAIYTMLRAEVPQEVKIMVQLNKPAIMLPYVQGGASYSFCDLPAFAWVVPL